MLNGKMFFPAILACLLMAAKEGRTLHFDEQTPLRAGVESRPSSGSSRSTLTLAGRPPLQHATTFLQDGKTASRSGNAEDTIPEQNSLDDRVIEKQNFKSKSSSRDSIKHFRRYNRRRVTEGLREFWDKLDQRYLNSNSAKNGKLTNISNSESGNGNTSKLNNETSPENTVKFLVENNTAEQSALYDEFPFLSNKYDYSYFYYDDEAMAGLNLTDPTENIPRNSSTIKNKISGEFRYTTEVSYTSTDINIDDTTTQSYVFDDTISLLNSSKKATTTRNFTAVRLSKKLSDSLNIIPRLQARIMPKLTAESTSHVQLFSVAPPAIPLTAIDSFRSRRINDNDREPNRPRDILKEFPIFRHFSRNESSLDNRRKTFSLHERLQHRLKTPDSSNTTTYFDESFPVGSDSSNVDKLENATFSPAFVPGKLQHLNEGSELQNKSKNADETMEPSQADDTANNVTKFINETESIQKNVTFSTSKTHKTAETSALDLRTTPVFESQLGVAPLGEMPFGISPFGATPMGELPFGLSPEGVYPLGNFSAELLSDDTTESSANTEGADGPYHVQVTGPDGSINGDYIVVDPVTGDVNGVRYEAAHDVDPLLVQRALLNFLSLDPRLMPSNSPLDDEYSIYTTELSTDADVLETELPRLETTTENTLKEVSLKEVALKEVALKEVALKEVALKEVALKEVALKEVTVTQPLTVSRT